MSVAVVGGETPAAEASAPRTTGRKSYGRYVTGKFLGSLGSLLFMLVVNFFLFRVLPGDPARVLGRGRLSTPEQVAEYNKTHGLDQPLVQQFFTFLKNTFTGDLGISIKYNLPVSEMILDRMWPTLLLVGTSTLLSTMIGIWMGINQAWKRNSFFDRSTTGGALVLYSMPEWWLGLVLIAVLAVGPGPIPSLFPTGGLHSTDAGSGAIAQGLDVAWHLALPVFTLTLAYLAEYSLIMRASVLDEVGEDYLTTARAKGLRDIQVRNRHAVRNALLPATTVVALNLGFVVSGAITIEKVFSIPGLGLLANDALEGPDFWVLQGTFLVASGAVIFANLAANLLYGLLDPRVRT